MAGAVRRTLATVPHASMMRGHRALGNRRKRKPIVGVPYGDANGLLACGSLLGRHRSDVAHQDQVRAVFRIELVNGSVYADLLVPERVQFDFATTTRFQVVQHSVAMTQTVDVLSVGISPEEREPSVGPLSIVGS